MRFPWLVLAAFMSLLAGSAEDVAAAEELESGSRARSVAAVRPGLSVEGSSFYVWDEDASAARAWARELAGSRAASRRS
jgi:hypothetical protein